MIKAYLAWISTHYEGEDIEIRYNIFEDDKLIKEKTFFKDYAKPALCGLIATQELLKDLEEYVEELIIVVINDGALFESLNGTSRTHNKEVQDLARKVRKELDAFSDIVIENVSGDHLKVEEWDDILRR